VVAAGAWADLERLGPAVRPGVARYRWVFERYPSRVETQAIVEAIAEAFARVGKPYDFEFDFNVSTRRVCTELVYRSYHGRALGQASGGALRFELVKRIGRYTLTADAIARMIAKPRAQAANEPAAFELVELLLKERPGAATRIDAARRLERFSELITP
jgi:hypothetical protein